MRAALLFVVALAACGSGSTPPPGAESLGQSCDLGPDAPTSPRQQAWRTDAPECASQLCVRPATSPRVSMTPDPGGFCASDCQKDDDCPGKGRCETRFLCVVPFTEGPLACRRLCVCNDFYELFSGPSAGIPDACRQQ